MTRETATEYVENAVENFFDDFVCGLPRSFPLSYHTILRVMITKLEQLANDGEER